MSSSAVLTNPSVERVRGGARACRNAGRDRRASGSGAHRQGCGRLSRLRGGADRQLPRVPRARRATRRCSSCPRAPAASTSPASGVLGEPVAKADAEFVRRHTGFAIGGVAPVGHRMSKRFRGEKPGGAGELWAAAGHPHTVFRLSYDELVRITGGTGSGTTRHERDPGAAGAAREPDRRGRGRGAAGLGPEGADREQPRCRRERDHRDARRRRHASRAGGG